MKRKDFLSSVLPLAATFTSAGKGELLIEPDKPVSIPPYLKKGDTIGICCPAGYITLDDIQPAVFKLKEWGYNVKPGETIGKKDFTFGGTDQERANIDFFKLPKGDKFALSYTERYINDTLYDGIDSLRAAFFEYKGEKIYAFPFQQQRNGKVEYYDQDGKALKNFFLKAPLKFVNITSRFSKNRFHPVQLRWKPHNGTDYAAPRGTPIMTTASGIVEQAGYTAGNGNFVKVKHDKTYSTQYLHMSKILVRRGQHVKQGEIIEKVGSTGLASGPHVCYRFWKNGVQVDGPTLKIAQCSTYGASKPTKI